MPHNAAELSAKLKEMYPEIKQHDIDMELEYKEDKNYWVIKLTKGDHKLHTLLNKEDADSCLDGVQCIYLGVQLGQFIKNFEYYN